MARQKVVTTTDTIEEQQALEPIAPTQQTFIEHLLSGKNISQAATVAGISRRTATYWLADPSHPVAIEYEKQRLQQRQDFYARVASLHELAFKAMEDTLSAAAPPALRFQAAKYLYEKHLEQLCAVQVPRPAAHLARSEEAEMQTDESNKLLAEVMNKSNQNLAQLLNKSNRRQAPD